VLGAVFGVLLAACGGTIAAERHQPGNPSAGLLQAWADFPLNATPRPIVLVGSPVLVPSKFPDGDAKLAFMSGAFDLPGALPSGPVTADGYPVTSATAALGMLRSQSHQAVTNSAASPAAKRLAITAARLSRATFITDRGEQSLPAWLFSVAGIDDPVGVLAVSPTAQWSPPGRSSQTDGTGSVGGATVGSDHRTLTVGFIGAQAGTGACTASYELSLAESATAVVVAVIEHSHNASTTICDLVGHLRTASAALSTPLGARVVLDAATGLPVAVTSQDKS
jgi:hypothetical protein